mmetsp:Transcript_56193/g.90989  ORF Transcript_56193/g.90989 Transcript_56193/m.90989 type:complete len:212 (+) Transcript_56193:605-1240(+)
MGPQLCLAAVLWQDLAPWRVLIQWQATAAWQMAFLRVSSMKWRVLGIHAAAIWPLGGCKQMVATCSIKGEWPAGEASRHLHGRDSWPAMGCCRELDESLLATAFSLTMGSLPMTISCRPPPTTCLTGLLVHHASPSSHSRSCNCRTNCCGMAPQLKIFRSLPARAVQRTQAPSRRCSSKTEYGSTSSCLRGDHGSSVPLTRALNRRPCAEP